MNILFKTFILLLALLLISFNVLWWLIAEQPGIFKDPTAARVLIKAGLDQPLTELFSHIIGDPGLEKLFILAGANPAPLSWYEKPYTSLSSLFKGSSKYPLLKDQLNKELERGIKVLFINTSLSTKAGQANLYEIMYHYFFSLHPDLAFIGTSALNQLIDQKLPFSRDEPLRILTLRSLNS